MSVAVVLNEIENIDYFSKGLSHSTGVGAALDLVEAHKWFNIAAMNGNNEAKIRRKELSEVMSEFQISAAQRAARDYLTKGVN